MNAFISGISPFNIKPKNTYWHKQKL